MAKLTVSAEHVRRFPELASKLGQTVDASVIQEAEVAARKAPAKTSARKQPVTPASAAAKPVKNVAAPRTKKADTKKA